MRFRRIVCNSWYASEYTDWCRCRHATAGVPRCVLVSASGGGWQRGDKNYRFNTYGNVGVALAKAGYCCFVMNYRLWPEVRLGYYLTCQAARMCMYTFCSEICWLSLRDTKNSPSPPPHTHTHARTATHSWELLKQRDKHVFVWTTLAGTST